VQKAATEAIIVISRLALYEFRRVAFRKESDGTIQANTAESVLTQFEQDIAARQIRARKYGHSGCETERRKKVSGLNSGPHDRSFGNREECGRVLAVHCHLGDACWPTPAQMLIQILC
jgi:hypothetical protein